MKTKPTTLILALLTILLLSIGVFFTLRTRPIDALEQADTLFSAGHYHAALASYRAIPNSHKRYPQALAHQGMLHTMRAELAKADELLSRAVGQGLDEQTLELVRLHQGAIALHSQRPQEAQRLWALIPANSALSPHILVLQAEQQLWASDPASAEQNYRQALSIGLPADWAKLVHTRLALLRASSDPVTARSELDQAATMMQEQASTKPIPFLLPLLPDAQPHDTQIQTALDAPAEQHALLLGQLYLNAGLYTMAEAQFQRIEPDSAQAIPAAAFAAYTRWRAGDRAGGLEQLQALVERAPDETHVRTLLALVALDINDKQETQAQLDTIRSLAPNAASTALAWGQWHASQRDYVEASRLYTEALQRASPQERGLYALHLARFNLATAWQLCEQGLPAAEEAVARNSSVEALVLLSQIRLGCGNNGGAWIAANRALALDPNNPEALYRAGLAMLRLGKQPDAYELLVRAADAQPGGVWRERAESQINQFGLEK